MGQKPFLSIGAQAAWGSDPRRAERLPVLGSPLSPLSGVFAHGRDVPQMSLLLCVYVHVCSHMPWKWSGYVGIPLRSCFLSSVSLPLLSPFSIGRGVCDSCRSFLSISLYPSPGAPYPKPLPLSSLLPEASSRYEECCLVTVPIPSPRFQVPSPERESSVAHQRACSA